MSDEKLVRTTFGPTTGDKGFVELVAPTTIPAGTLTLAPPTPALKLSESPTALLRRKWIADMNEHIDLDTHWLLGGCGGFVLMQKGETESVDCILWNAPSGHLLDFDKPARSAIANGILRQLKKELCRTLKLGAEEVEDQEVGP